MNWTPPEIPPLAKSLEAELRSRIDQKTKPLGALGRLEEIALQLGLIQGTAQPVLREPTVLVFAGDHGLAAERVSPFPQEVTTQMVLNFLGGGAAINVFARQHGLKLLVVDSGVAGDLPSHPQLRAAKVRRGTRNARRERAMTEQEVTRCLDEGARIIGELAARGANAVLFGEMGIGNTSSASLLMSSLLDVPVENCVGRGAGHDDEGLRHKVAVLSEIARLHGAVRDPVEALSCYGGYEIAMIAGAMLAAASRRMTVVVDGFIVSVALLVASRLNPGVPAYAVFAHGSAERGHARLLKELGARPLLDLGLRLGEGSGAALAWPLLVSSVAFLNEMATFASAGVSEKESAVVPA
jgi:nicotinate-nucleotide--dimethylbenzimidazole phosphoribosyltransferase